MESNEILGNSFKYLFSVILLISILAFSVSTAHAAPASCGGSTPCNCTAGVYGLNESRTFTTADDLTNCDQGIHFNTPNVVLNCNGRSIVGVSANNGMQVSANNVTIKNCIISNYTNGINFAGQYNLTFENNTIFDVVYGINGYSGQYWVKVIDNEIYHAVRGINFYATYDGDLIQGNYIHDITDYGISLSWIINANIIDNTVVNTTDGIGIYLDYVHTSNLTNNTILDNQYSGVYLSNSNGDTISGGEIAHNNIDESSSEAGIRMDDTSGDTITGVYMHHNKKSAIHGQQNNFDASIIGNNIDDNCGGEAGILFNNVTNLLIEGNNITDGTGYGIELYDYNNVQILSNKISNNTYDGIYMNRMGSSGSTISYNNITYNHGDGAYIFTDGDVTMEGNNFISNEDAGLWSSGSHINVTNGNFINNGYNDGGEGIHDDSGPSVYWTVTEPVDCINNTISVIDGVSGIENINLDNCPIIVDGDDLLCGGEYGDCECGDYVIGDITLEDSLTCDNTGTSLIIGADNVTLDCADNYISSDGDNIGVLINGVSGATIKNCEIYGYSDEDEVGISLQNDANNNLLLNNTLYDNFNGIELKWRSNNNQIINNTVTDNSYLGISLRFSSNNNIIQGNNASFNCMAGIRVSKSNETLIDNNDANSNNGLNGCTNQGIDLSYASNNTVTNNRILSNPNTGIIVANSGGNILENNTIEDGIYGVYFNGVSYSEITNNTISNSSNSCIYVQGGNSYNTISDNTITNSYGESYGIYVDDYNTDVNYNTVECTTSLTTGIYLDSNAYDSELEGNEVYGCEDGLDAQGVSSFTVTNDYYHDNGLGANINNCEIVYIEDTDFDSNYNYGIYVTGSDVYVTDGNLINNGWDFEGDGIYEYPGDTVYWRVTEPVNCTNNEIWVYGDVSGFDLINTDNCPIYVKESQITEDNFCGGDYGECSCGDYVMADVTLEGDFGCDGDALTVGTNDITIDCGDNSIYGNGISGIGIYSMADGLTVRNCLIEDFGEAGIHLYQSKNNLIELNTFNNNGVSDASGIGLFGVTDSEILNNYFYYNDVGVYLGDSSNGNTIQGNTIMFSDYDGIAIGYSDSNTIKNNTIANNSDDGIFVTTSDGNEILDNDIHDNSGDGIEVYTPSKGSNHVIEWNEINYNMGYGILMNGEDNVTIRDNNFTGNYLDSVYGVSTEAKVYNCNFEGNGWDNGNYAIYDDSRSIDWTVDKDIDCINNDVSIEGAFSIKNDAKINAVNCTITVQGNEIDLEGGQSGYLSEYVDIDENESYGMGGSDAGIELNLTSDEDGYEATVTVTTYDQLPGGVSGYGLMPLGTWIDIETSDPDETMAWTIIKIYYTDEQVATAGLDESTLRIKYYNDTDGTWEIYNPPRGGVNTTGNYVWANVTHFSGFGVFGSAPVAQQSGGGLGGGLPSTGQNSTWTGDTLTSAMVVRDVISFTLGTESHTIKLISLGGDYALLNISSPDPDTVTLHVAETKNVDVNKDGTNDISIMLSKIELGKAYFTFSKLATAEQPPATQPPAAEQPPATQPPATQPPITQPAVTDNTTLIIIVAALVIIAVIAALWYKSKME